MDGYDIAGGGLIRRVLPDPLDDARRGAMQRNLRWERGHVGAEARAERLGQRGRLIVVSGPSPTRKETAKALEARLFATGCTTYYMGLASFVHGVDRDVPHDRSREAQAEHFRRLGEVAHLLVDAGLLLVVSADTIGLEEWALLRAVLGSDPVSLVWIGDGEPPANALRLEQEAPPNAAVGRIMGWLSEAESAAAATRPMS
ncbi:MAG: adenylyl-sulfate kinase [Planctomycetota bacterium]